MENKIEIVKRLKLLLMVTRAGSRIADLILNENQDKVVVLFRNGAAKEINIEADSGIAIIRDVVGSFHTGSWSVNGILSKCEIEILRRLLDELAEGMVQEESPQRHEGRGRERHKREYHPLSEEQKKGLSDKEVFMKEYGLYTGFVADPYWSGLFKETYGYMPELL